MYRVVLSTNLGLTPTVGAMSGSVVEMLNTAALEAEMEYRQQRLIAEAEEYRRASRARAAASAPSPGARLRAALAGRAPRRRAARRAM
jgi:hypothetical protein